jgi:hypothetical protein
MDNSIRLRAVLDSGWDDEHLAGADRDVPRSQLHPVPRHPVSTPSGLTDGQARSKARHAGASLSIGEIARGPGRAPAPVKGHFYDPCGEKVRAVNARDQGACW